MIKNIKILKLKPILLTVIYFSLINFAYSHNHFPITIDSKIMIAKGKIAYENNCVSCHMINLSGAENWKGVDSDGHRKAPPLDGSGHTRHHHDKTIRAKLKTGLTR